MKTVCIALFAALVGVSSGFTASSSSPTRSSTALFAYVPDGFTPESYKKFKEEERKRLRPGNLGGLGPRGFKSRSMQSFQEAMERGEATHLMPMFNAKEKLKSGKIRKEDIPYMQRGGSWDNSDVKNARNKKTWLASDKAYAAGGYRKEQSVSVLGFGEGLDWSGSRAKRGPESAMGAAPKFSKNYKAPNVNDFKKGGDDKKKFFGLF